MLKGTTVVLHKNSLIHKGFEISDECMKSFVEKHKYQELSLEKRIGKLFNFRYENETVIANYEIFIDISFGALPMNKISLPDKTLVTELGIGKAQAVINIPKGELK